MEIDAANNLIVEVGKTRCTKVERDAAINLAVFLHSQWRKSKKSEIIKVDKTNHNNEEPININ